VINAATKGPHRFPYLPSNDTRETKGTTVAESVSALATVAIHPTAIFIHRCHAIAYLLILRPVRRPLLRLGRDRRRRIVRPVLGIGR
jgi:hypothetical protein